MELFDCIKTRRCIRKFQSTPVPWDLVSKILDAGRLAPNAGNLQNWKFIVVLDQGTRQKIAEACLRQYWMAKAPVHIVVCADPKVSERYYGTRGDRLYSVQNCAAASQNMLLQAHNLGLGACWVGAFDENMVSNAVGLPEEVRPQVIIPLGYPDEKPAEPAKYPLENITYFEKWRGKIQDVPAYMGYYSIKWEKGAKKAKAALEKQSEKLAVKAKEVAAKVKKKVEEKRKRYKDLKEFKKVHGLK